MDYQKLANLLFPNVTATPEDMENRYPPRKLPEGAKVTRMAPSPTGFMHLGNLFGAITDERLAHQSGGIFMLRIEDTDKKREVENGVETIISVFKNSDLISTRVRLPTENSATTAPTVSAKERTSTMCSPKSSLRRVRPTPASAPRRSFPPCASSRRQRA